MIDYDIPRCSRVCSRTGRTLSPAETCYSALVEEDGTLKRLDFSPEAWRSDNPKVIGWWRSVIPSVTEKRIKLAPNDILLELFDQWIGEPKRKDYLYILTLLMVRRRIFRFEKEEKGDAAADDESDAEPFRKSADPLLVVYSPRREMTYSVPIVPLDEERIGIIQEELAALLYSGPAEEESEGD